MSQDGEPPNPDDGSQNKGSSRSTMWLKFFHRNGFRAKLPQNSSRPVLVYEATNKTVSLDLFKREIVSFMASRQQKKDAKNRREPAPEETETRLEITPPNSPLHPSDSCSTGERRLVSVGGKSYVLLEELSTSDSSSSPVSLLANDVDSETEDVDRNNGHKNMEGVVSTDVTVTEKTGSAQEHLGQGEIRCQSQSSNESGNKNGASECPSDFNVEDDRAPSPPSQRETGMDMDDSEAEVVSSPPHVFSHLQEEFNSRREQSEGELQEPPRSNASSNYDTDNHSQVVEISSGLDSSNNEANRTVAVTEITENSVPKDSDSGAVTSCVDQNNVDDSEAEVVSSPPHVFRHLQEEFNSHREQSEGELQEPPRSNASSNCDTDNHSQAVEISSGLDSSNNEANRTVAVTEITEISVPKDSASGAVTSCVDQNNVDGQRISGKRSAEEADIDSLNTSKRQRMSTDKSKDTSYEDARVIEDNITCQERTVTADIEESSLQSQASAGAIQPNIPLPVIESASEASSAQSSEPTDNTTTEEVTENENSNNRPSSPSSITEVPVEEQRLDSDVQPPFLYVTFEIAKRDGLVYERQLLAYNRKNHPELFTLPPPPLPDSVIEAERREAIANANNSVDNQDYPVLSIPEPQGSTSSPPITSATQTTTIISSTTTTITTPIPTTSETQPSLPGAFTEYRSNGVNSATVSNSRVAILSMPSLDADDNELVVASTSTSVPPSSSSASHDNNVPLMTTSSIISALNFTAPPDKESSSSFFEISSSGTTITAAGASEAESGNREENDNEELPDLRIRTDIFGDDDADSICDINETENTPGSSTEQGIDDLQELPADHNLTDTPAQVMAAAVLASRGYSPIAPGILPNRVFAVPTTTSCSVRPAVFQCNFARTTSPSSLPIPVAATMNTAPVAVTVSTMNTAPVAVTVSTMNTAPVAATVSAMNTAPVAATVSTMNTAPVAATVSPMNTAPVAATVSPMNTAPVAATVSTMNTAPVAATVSPMNTAPVAATVSTMNTAPVAATVSPMNTAPVAATVSTMYTAPVAATVSPMNTAPVAAAVSPMNTAPVAAAVSPVNTAPVAAAVSTATMNTASISTTSSNTFVVNPSVSTPSTCNHAQQMHVPIENLPGPSQRPVNTGDLEKELKSSIDAIVKSAEDYLAQVKSLAASHSAPSGTADDIRIKKTVLLLNDVREKSFRNHETVDSVLHGLRIKYGSVASLAPRVRMASAKPTVEELAEYFEVLMDSVMLSKQIPSQRIRGVLIIQITRIIRILGHYMHADNHVRGEQTFNNVMSILTTKQSLIGRVSESQVGFYHMLLKFWHCISSSTRDPGYSNGAMMDHTNLGIRVFKERVAKFKLSLSKNVVQAPVAVPLEAVNHTESAPEQQQAAAEPHSSRHQPQQQQPCQQLQQLLLQQHFVSTGSQPPQQLNTSQIPYSVQQTNHMGSQIRAMQPPPTPHHRKQYVGQIQNQAGMATQSNQLPQQHQRELAFNNGQQMIASNFNNVQQLQSSQGQSRTMPQQPSVLQSRQAHPNTTAQQQYQQVTNLVLQQRHPHASWTNQQPAHRTGIVATRHPSRPINPLQLKQLRTISPHHNSNSHQSPPYTRIRIPQNQQQQQQIPVASRLSNQQHQQRQNVRLASQQQQQQQQINAQLQAQHELPQYNAWEQIVMQPCVAAGDDDDVMILEVRPPSNPASGSTPAVANSQTGVAQSIYYSYGGVTIGETPYTGATAVSTSPVAQVQTSSLPGQNQVVHPRPSDNIVLADLLYGTPAAHMRATRLQSPPQMTGARGNSQAATAADVAAAAAVNSQNVNQQLPILYMRSEGQMNSYVRSADPNPEVNSGRRSSNDFIPPAPPMPYRGSGHISTRQSLTSSPGTRASTPIIASVTSLASNQATGISQRANVFPAEVSDINMAQAQANTVYYPSMEGGSVVLQSRQGQSSNTSMCSTRGGEASSQGSNTNPSNWNQ